MVDLMTWNNLPVTIIGSLSCIFWAFLALERWKKAPRPIRPLVAAILRRMRNPDGWTKHNLSFVSSSGRLQVGPWYLLVQGKPSMIVAPSSVDLWPQMSRTERKAVRVAYRGLGYQVPVLKAAADWRLAEQRMGVET